MPGIYSKHRNGQQWWSIAGPPGILIPVRDVQRRIVALKVRRDADNEPRYVYVSSRSRGGPSPGAPVHVPQFEGDTTTIRITEGELKAGIATELSGVLTLGFDGLSGDLDPVLRVLNTQVVLVALDADSVRKRNVALALQRRFADLAKQGFAPELEVWDEKEGKGIDDLLAAGKVPEVLKGNDAEAAISRLVEAAKEAQPTEREQKAARATEHLRDLRSKLKADSGFAFEEDTIEALLFLQLNDKTEFARTWDILRKSKVSLREPREELKRRRSASKAGVTEADPSGFARVAGTMLAAGPNGINDCPAPDLVIPEPYYVTPSATGCVVPSEDGEDGKPEDFAFAPILLEGRLRDEEEGVEYHRLTWRRHDGWRRLTSSRSTTLDSRKLVELAGHNFPVASDNVKAVASYLHRFESLNYVRIPTARISHHLGWQGEDGKDGFLWGTTHLLPDGDTAATVDLDRMAPAEWKPGVIGFRPLTTGVKQIASAYHSQGTFEGWIEAINLLQPYPRARLIFYTGLVPPILEIIQIPNFTAHIHWRTSTGKTTTLRVTAGHWGKPDEKSGDGALNTWDVTPVFFERNCQVISGMPIILDETQRARDPRVLAKFVYELESGRGRGRGNTQSVDNTRTWRTVLASSGETSLRSSTQVGGLRTRALEIEGLPFNQQDEETRKLVDRLNLSITS